MEKRGLSLKGVFVRYLLLSGGTCALLVLGWLFALALLINMEVVFPANAGAEGFSQAAPQVAQATAETFSPDLVPAPCRYVLLKDSQVLTSNAVGPYWEAARQYLAGESEGLTNRVLWYTQYYNAVRLADGAICLFQYDYAVHWCTSQMENTLPDFQTLYLLSLAAVCLCAIALFTRHYARLVAHDAAMLSAAGAKLAAGDVSASVAGTARLREFRQALDTMDGLRDELAHSLRSQWAMEQQRSEDMAALAHDLKTPLTIVTGNAELLAEEDLTDAQHREVEAVLRGAESARQYVDRLRSLAAAAQSVSPRTPVHLTDFAARCAQAGEGLCAPRKLHFVCTPPPDVVLEAREEELLRAVTNLLDNAARFAESRVTLEMRVADGFAHFCVQDDGPGFSPEALQKAGRSLFTSDAARPRDGHTGMGLRFARAVAEDHGGELILSSQNGGRAVLTAAL